MSRTDFDPTNRTGKYILNDAGEPVEEHDLFKWADWYEHADRQLAVTRIGETTVSTIFLGLDMNPFRRDGTPPVLWETMAFGGVPALMRRYTTKADALAGHEAVCAEVTKGRP